MGSTVDLKEWEECEDCGDYAPVSDFHGRALCQGCKNDRMLEMQQTKGEEECNLEVQQ